MDIRKKHSMRVLQKRKKRSRLAPKQQQQIHMTNHRSKRRQQQMKKQKSTTAKSHDKSPQPEAAAATQRKTRVHQKTGESDSNETAAKMDSKDDELKALIVKRKAMDNENKDQLNNSEA